MFFSETQYPVSAMWQNNCSLLLVMMIIVNVNVNNANVQNRGTLNVNNKEQ